MERAPRALANQTMQVIHVDTGTAMQGGQWQVLYLLQGLAKRGVENRLLAPGGSPLLAAARASGCDTQALRMLPAVPDPGKFDLVHAHDARAHTMALMLRKPLIVSRRVAFPLKRTPFSRFKYSRPVQFLAVSHYVEKVLIDAGVSEKKISIVYDGVPVPEPVSPDHRSIVVALDTEDPGKGKAVIEQASRMAGIPVHFSSALLQDLPGAWLFVYITELEGLGSAALLAMAHGVPVLASAAGGLPEIVSHRVTGMLTGNAPHDVAAAMQSLNEDRAAAANLGQNGRAEVERRFTTERMVENTIRAYEKVMSC